LNIQAEKEKHCLLNSYLFASSKETSQKEIQILNLFATLLRLGNSALSRS